MKYMVTLNGKQYEVEVEKGNASAVCVGAAPAAAASVAAPTPVATPTPTAAPTPAGGEVVAAPMPGVILAIRCTAGQAVKAGDVLFILEAMKMENEVCAPRDGTIGVVSVQKGASVETGTALCTM